MGYALYLLLQMYITYYMSYKECGLGKQVYTLKDTDFSIGMLCRYDGCEVYTLK